MKDNNIIEEKEIDIIAITKKLWIKKNFILKCLAIGCVTGIVVAFSIPKEYTAKIILAPEQGNSSSNNMGALAVMAGLNIGSTASESLSPEIYPDIVSSNPFIISLFNVKIVDEKENLTTSLYEYFEKHQQKVWWSYIISAPSKLIGIIFSSNEHKNTQNLSLNPFQLTAKQTSIINNIKSSINIASNKKTGSITISVTMQNAKASAIITDSITKSLQKYITDYRTTKARQDLLFNEKLYHEAKQNYYKAQQNYATYIDGNMNIVSARYKTTQDRLQNEMTLAFSVYNQITQQLEVAKMKVQETTPAFTVIQPSTTPLKAAKPKKATILIGFISLSFVISCVYIIVKNLLNNSK